MRALGDEPQVLFYDGQYKPGYELNTLSINELFQRFNFRYIYTPSLKQHLISVFGPHVENQTDILEEPEAHIAIHQTCKTMGYGLVAVKKIPAKTVVSEYLGTLGSYDEVGGDKEEYLACLTSTKDIQKYGVQQVAASSLWVNAKNEGNLTRFACHMPDEQPIQGYRVKLANLDLMIAKGRCRNYALLVTKTDVEPGEELGFDYGEHFVNKISPVYYDLDRKKFFRVSKEKKSSSPLPIAPLQNHESKASSEDLSTTALSSGNYIDYSYVCRALIVGVCAVVLAVLATITYKHYDIAR